MSKNQKMEEAMNHAKANTVDVESTEVNETVETEEKIAVELTQEQFNKLMAIVEPEEKVGFMRRIINKIHKPKITLKKAGICLGVIGAVAGGVYTAKKLAGNNEEDFVDVDSTESLPDNDFDNSENNETQETEEVEVTEF